jgi:hypothetical protein
MCGLAVVTINKEYVRDFGAWSSNPNSLESEVSAILNMSPSKISLEAQKRREVAVSKHSMDQWTNKLYSILNEPNL